MTPNVSSSKLERSTWDTFWVSKESVLLIFFFKLDAIGSAPRPRDLSQLRSFAWMLNYYSKSINDFSSKLHPLYQLLSSKTEWFCTKECETAFISAKEVLSSEQGLAHYDPQKPSILSVDASPYGIAGLESVLSHRWKMAVNSRWSLSLAHSAAQKRILPKRKNRGKP